LISQTRNDGTSYFLQDSQDSTNSAGNVADTISVSRFSTATGKDEIEIMENIGVFLPKDRTK